jgi:hypothetical protein
MEVRLLGSPNPISKTLHPTDPTLIDVSMQKQEVQMGKYLCRLRPRLLRCRRYLRCHRCLVEGREGVALRLALVGQGSGGLVEGSKRSSLLLRLCLALRPRLSSSSSSSSSSYMI